MASEVDVQGDTHDAIMGATYHALCKHGYAHLTMQDIADEFDKSRSLLHYHYDTKEELMLVFLDRVIGWIGNRLAESDTEEPLARLEEFIDKFVIEPGEEQRETFALAILQLRVQAAHNEEFREKLAAHYRENASVVSGIIEDGVEAGVFHEDVDPEWVGRSIYTSMAGARMFQVTMGDETATLRMRDAVAEFAVDQLIADGRSVSAYAGGDFSRRD
ncbi:TetR/AcrR family transcriptional regulator [Halosimplex halobium]|uniref:TetR/AcrR family transcriptional regulator n=1 Tax=Halosimplex halobium TaxID=3396618 RepID=UPI003F552C42